MFVPSLRSPTPRHRRRSTYRYWRTRRALAGALITAACLVLEPLARKVTIDPITYRDVWIGEVAIGLAFAVAVLLARFSHRFSRPSEAWVSRD